MVNPVTQDERYAIKEMFLKGESMNAIAKHFGRAKATISRIINKSEAKTLADKLRDDSAIEVVIEEVKVKENKLQVIIDSMLDLVKAAIQDGIDAKNKHLFIKDFSKILDSMDRIKRLDDDKPTDIKETRDKSLKIDVAKVMEQLETPEQKKNFLLGQLHAENRTNNPREATIPTRK